MSTSFTANTPARVIKVINVTRSFLFRNCRSCLCTPASDTSLCPWDLTPPSTNSPPFQTYSCTVYSRIEITMRTIAVFIQGMKKQPGSFTDTLQGDRDDSHPHCCWVEKLSGVSSKRRDRAQLKIQVSNTRCTNSQYIQSMSFL